MARGRLVVVGGGVLGTMHARVALARGWDVVQLEREAGPRGASVRNFGLIWVSGRAQGEELDLALRARELWHDVGASCPGTGFRPNGSLTIAATPEELAVIEEVAARPDAAARGVRVVDPGTACTLNPAFSGRCLAALHCALDAAVEPRFVLGALRGSFGSERYRWLPGREVRSVRAHEVVDATGERHRGDLVVVCVGAAHSGLLTELVPDAPVRRVRLQMLETEPADFSVHTSLADGDSLRYYPAFSGPSLDRLGPQGEVGAAWGIQLLLVQRLDGSLTIGDTHRVDEPFAFDLDEEPTRCLLQSASRVLGRTLPSVRRRWAGVYSQLTEEAGDSLYLRHEFEPGVAVITGPGGRGMTLSPAIAEATFRD